MFHSAPTKYPSAARAGFVKNVFIRDILVGTMFRYKKKFYTRNSIGFAFSYSGAGVNYEFLDIDSLNMYDFVCVKSGTTTRTSESFHE